MQAMLPQCIYEFRKGVRRLFMLTMNSPEARIFCDRLAREGIDVHVQPVNAVKRNVFFGQAAAVEVVRQLVIRPLYQLNPEEDFILGTLLGYDTDQQCRRYLARREGLTDGLVGDTCCEMDLACLADKPAPRSTAFDHLA